MGGCSAVPLDGPGNPEPVHGVTDSSLEKFRTMVAQLNSSVADVSRIADDLDDEVDKITTGPDRSKSEVVARAEKALEELVESRITAHPSSPLGVALAALAESIDRPDLAGLSLAIGVTVESRDQAWRITELKHKWFGRRFASLEPLLGPIPPDLLRDLDWIIIGGLSGSWLPEGWTSRRSLAEAQAEWSRPIIRWARDAGIPVLVKTHPAQIPGLDLQQYPDWFDLERPEQQQARMF